jgi:hypothetical protein
MSKLCQRLFGCSIALYLYTENWRCFCLQERGFTLRFISQRGKYFLIIKMWLLLHFFLDHIFKSILVMSEVYCGTFISNEERFFVIVVEDVHYQQ